MRDSHSPQPAPSIITDSDIRIEDAPSRTPSISEIRAIANRTGDLPVEIPSRLPTRTKRLTQNRHAETSVYPLLETNVDISVMEFSQEKIPATKSALSVGKHGNETPFVHHTTVQGYVEGLIQRNGYDNFVEYSTTVEKVEKLKDGKTWRLFLRREQGEDDYWWYEDFDAVLVANGHYTVPWVPEIAGLEDFARKYPGSVEHSKGYRGPDRYRGKVSLRLGCEEDAVVKFAIESSCCRGLGLRYGYRSRPDSSRATTSPCSGPG